MRPSYAAMADELYKIAAISDEERRLRPGDIILTSAGSKDAFKGRVASGARRVSQDIVTAAIRPFTGPYGHAAIYVGDGQLIDAHPSYGVGHVDLSSFDNVRHIKVLRPKLPKTERDEAAEIAESLVGSKYSTPTAIKAWLATKFKGLDPEKAGIICSNMIANLYGGKVTPGKNPNFVLPGDLNSSPRLRTVVEVA